MKTVDREKLWESYQKNPVSEIREQIIIEYAPLVKLVAGRLSMYLGYNVEYEDLVSYGIFCPGICHFSGWGYIAAYNISKCISAFLACLYVL